MPDSTPRPRPAPGRAGLWLGAVVSLVLAGGCRRPEPAGYQGYLEGEFVHLGAPVPGMLVQRPATRGAQVRAGDVLFVLESEAEAATLREAGLRLAQSRARLENLLKGRRPSEIAALDARVEQARATLDLATRELARREQLHREDVVSKSEIDSARAQHAAAQAALAAAGAELETARLGGRDDEIKGAEADRDAAEAALARARWSVDQKTQRSPAEGRVHDTYLEPGEFVAAGSPVLSLLPPGGIKVRFFVPQADVSRVVPGTRVEVFRDGAEGSLPAQVNYVGTRPEFTPPVIYSRSSRARLVFLVEAAFAPGIAATLNPGQPVDVQLAAPPR